MTDVISGAASACQRDIIRFTRPFLIFSPLALISLGYALYANAKAAK
jgi:hypothetical protein